MNRLNLRQVLLFYRNKHNPKIYDICDKQHFFFIFLQHFKEYCLDNQVSFKVLEPLLDFSLLSEQKTAISFADREIGVLSLLQNSFSAPASLVYYSTSTQIFTIIFTEQALAETSVSNYLYRMTSFYLLLKKESDLFSN